MANPATQIRRSGSFVAGLLIGLSIALATFALTDGNSGTWQIVLLVAAPALLALGFALQVLATTGAATVAHS